jgi:hypothetical protein
MSDFNRFKNYLIRIVSPAFAIIVLVCGITIFFPRSEKVSEDKLIIAYKDQIQSYKWTAEVDSIDGIILGSSTLRYGLSSNLLKSKEYAQWVNFSMDARDPIVNYILLKEYYSKIKPKIVLVGLDPWIFSKKYYQHRNTILLNDLNSMEKLNYLISVDHFLPIKLIENYLNKSEINKPKKITIPSDFGSVKLKRTAVNFNEVKEDWFEISKFGWSNIQFEYLLKIKNFCHANGIILVFVVPPKRKDYVEVSMTRFQSENKIWWEKICEILPNENIVGTYDALSQLNQDSIFAEAYHLNDIGQVAFSSYLKNEINYPKKIVNEYKFITSSMQNQTHQVSN